MQPTAWDFQNQLMAILNSAQQKGEPHIDVESNNLHAQVVGQSDSIQRPTVCGEVMKRMMRPGDSIVNELPGEKSVTIRYIFRQPALT